MSTMTEARIEADPTVPVIRITREFAATPEQLFRAHTDPELFVRWVGPDGMRSRIDHWDARTGGSWRYVATATARRVRLPRVLPRGPAGPHRADLHLRGDAGRGGAGDAHLRGPRRRPHPAGRVVARATASRARDGWLQSGMEVGVNEGYAKLDGLLRDGAV